MLNKPDSANHWDLAARVDHFQNLPLLREDDPEWDMGETNWHAVFEHIIRYGIAAHVARQPRYRAFSNMNLHYQPRFPRQCVSPDVMVVTPIVPAPDDLRSYRIGPDGPAPLLTAEVLSPETAQEGDLDTKVYIYAMIGVAEYLLVDALGDYVPQRLLLKKLQPDRTWVDEQDPDGGVTSQLGFRLIWDTDGQLRVLHAKTAKRYARPNEAQTEADRRQKAERRIRKLEAELNHLRGIAHEQAAQQKRRKGRKKS